MTSEQTEQFLTPAEGMVHVGYLELQTDICRACFCIVQEMLSPLLVFLPFVNEPQENKAQIPFCLAGRKIEALVVTYLNRVFSFLYLWMVSIGFT